MKKTLATVGTAFALAGAALSLPAHAHDAGDVLVRFGAAHVAPNDTSSALNIAGSSVAGTKATVNSDTQFGISLTYMINQHVGIEVLGATPFKHNVAVKGLGDLDGKLATVKHLPPTISVQYYPMAAGLAWQPYVGMGLNHTVFFDKKLTNERKDAGFNSLKLSNSTGLTAQLGIDVALNDYLFVNAAAWYMGINTNATVNLGDAPVAVDVQIDPMVYMLGLGIKF